MPEGTPEKGKIGGEAILSKIVVTEGAKKILNKAEQVVDKARLNEAVRILEQLEGEVSNMIMPKRFSREKIVSDSPYSMPDLVKQLQGLTEDEYKKAQLLRDLASLKNKIVLDIHRLKNVVIDIESTKIDKEEVFDPK